MDYAWLHFGKGNESRLTALTVARETDRPNYGLPVSGYGARIPTSWLVLWQGRWRRVYAACYGNASSLYIGPSRDWLAAVTIESN